MRKKNVTIYTNEMNCQLELGEGGVYTLWTDGDKFTIQKLKDLHQFLGEVLADTGNCVRIPEKSTVEADKITLAPKNRAFDPNPDGINF